MATKIEKQRDFLKSEDTCENTMSEYDHDLRDRLETCVSTLVNESNDAAVTIPLRLNAFDVIILELQNATSSMTSVPKPLKFLRPYFNILKETHGSLGTNKTDSDFSEGLLLRTRLADVLSVLAMTMGKTEERESLRYKLSGMK